MHAPASAEPMEIDSAAGALSVVDGITMGVQTEPENPQPENSQPPAKNGAVKRGNGERGEDKRPRKKRGAAPPCKRCAEFGGTQGGVCSGRGGVKHCRYFKESGEPK